MSQQNTLGTATQGTQYFDGTSVYTGVTGSTRQVLQANTSSAPTFSTATYPSTTTINQILYSSANNTIGGLSTGNNGVLITSASGVPSFLSAGTTGQVLIATTSNPPSWGNISSLSVTTLTGTANQVLVNGTSGTPTSGAITLTLPQSIATSSSVQFGKVGIGVSATFLLDVLGSSNLNLNADGTALVVSSGGTAGTQGGQIQLVNTGTGVPTPSKYVRIDSTGDFQVLNNAYGASILSITDSGNVSLSTIVAGAWHGTVIAGQYGGTGVANTGLTISLASGATGKVLASDSSGNATWQALSALGVTSITGTANQVIASASTGAVTLSTPQDIATTSAVRFGTLTLNGAATANTRLTITGVSNDVGGISVIGTIAAALGAASVIGISVAPTLDPPNSNLSANFNAGGTVIAPTGGTATSASLYTGQFFISGTGTITSSYGVFIGATSTASSPTVTNAYGAYFTNPGFGGTKAALYSDDASIGYTATTPPTNGLLVSGQSAFGTSSVNASARVTLSTASSLYGLLINGIQTSTASFGVGVYSAPTYFPSASTANLYTAIYGGPTFKIGGGNTESGTLASYYSSYGFTGNAGTLTTVAGFYFDGGGAAVGTITTAYGGFFGAPGAGSNNLALYSANMAIGSYSTTTPPTNGLIVSGGTSIGSSTATSLFNVGSANQFQVDSSGNILASGSIVSTGDLTIQRSVNGGVTTLLRNTNAGSSAFTFLEMGNDTSADKLVIFVNSSTRTTDGGAGNTTIRTDSGSLSIGAAGATQLFLNGSRVMVGTVTDDGVHELQVNGSISGTTITLSTSPTNGYVLTSDGSGNGTWQPVGSGGGGQINYATTSVKTSNYSAATTDTVILCDTTGGVFTVTLPHPVVPGKGFVVIDVGNFATTNNIDVAPTIGGDTINGNVSVVPYQINHNRGIGYFYGVSTTAYIANQTQV